MTKWVGIDKIFYSNLMLIMMFVCMFAEAAHTLSLFLLVVDLIMAKGVLLKSETKYLQTHTSLASAWMKIMLGRGWECWISRHTSKITMRDFSLKKNLTGTQGWCEGQNQMFRIH